MKAPQEEWDWLAFLSNWHEKEYERRYTLENVVVTPISLLTGLYAIIYLMLTQYDFKHSDILSLWLFAMCLTSSLLLSFYSAFYVYRSYAVLKNGAYRGVPEAKALRAHMDGLVTYYKQHEPEANGIEKFKEYFVELLADQITVNVINNDERTRDIQKSKKPLMGALLALFVALPCFLFNQMNKPASIQQVSIVQPSSDMIKASTPSKPLPPPPPPQRIIREITPRPTAPSRPNIEKK